MGERRDAGLGVHSLARRPAQCRALDEGGLSGPNPASPWIPHTLTTGQGESRTTEMRSRIWEAFELPESVLMKFRQPAEPIDI